MTQLGQQPPVVRAKPQANVYTVLLVITILALGTTIGAVMWNLTTVYGLTFEQIFQPLKEIVPG